MTFHVKDFPSLEAQWLAARKWMQSDPRVPLKRVGPRDKDS